MSHRAHIVWTFAITSIALFMTTLDNLVVTTALPTIQRELAASTRGPRVDGQRLHADLRRAAMSAPPWATASAEARVPSASASSRAARRRRALAPTSAARRRPRPSGRRRGDRHAADADPADRRVPGRATRARRWASGAASPASAVALGPLVGGAVVQGLSWQWIFWLNVPIGLR